MNFHIGKIYNMPTNFYFYKANQPRLWMEYCKKMEKNREVVLNIAEINNSCIEYCKNIVIFPENDEEITSDDDSWVDMKKIL
jgi:hypothetical protein